MNLFISCFLFKYILSIIQYNDLNFIYLTETTLINLKSNEDSTVIVGLFDYGFVRFDNNFEKEFDGIEENTELIIDNNNNIFFGCLHNNNLIMFNSTINDFEYAISDNNYINDYLYKCSLSFYNYVNKEKIKQSCIILTRSVYNNGKYDNYIQIYNYSLSLIHYFNIKTNGNSNINYNNIFQCITLFNFTKIFCSYIEDKVYGGFINNNLNGFISINTLYNNIKEYEDNLNYINFKMYSFSNETFLMIFQDTSLYNLILNKYDFNYLEDNYTKTGLLILELTSQISLEQFELIKRNENTVIMAFLIDDTFEFFFLKIPETSSSTIYYDKLIITEGIINKIQKFSLSKHEEKIKLFIYSSENKIYYTELYFPSNPLFCSTLYLNLISNSSGNFNINEIIKETSELNSSFLKLTTKSKNGIIIQTTDMENFSYTTSKHGIFNSTFFYDFSNNEYKINYFSQICSISIQVCNIACEECEFFSNDKYDSKCISCLENIYYSYINDESKCLNKEKNYPNIYFDSTENKFKDCNLSCLYCSINSLNCTTCNTNYYPSIKKTNYCNKCENDYNSLWYFDEVNLNGICLYNYNFCEEVSSIIDKPFMIYNTFECVEGCSSNYFFFYNLCISSCNQKNNMTSIGNKCLCSNGLKYYLNLTSFEVFCVENCPIEYPLYIQLNNQCASSCPNSYNLIYNNTCLKNCPYLTHFNDTIGNCECNYYTYIKDNKIFCTNSFKCPFDYPLLNGNNCIQKCPNLTSGKNCLNKCPIDTILIENNCLSLNDIMKDPDKFIRVFYSHYSYIIGNNYTILTYDTSLHSTNYAYSFDNSSKLFFGDCINILKQSNNISNNEHLIIFKIDINQNEQLTYKVEYSIYDLYGKKLDLNSCKNINIILELPLNFSNGNIDKNKTKELANYNYDIFNSNDSFYNDFCTIYKTKYGTDVTINQRKIIYYQNITLCEENCNYVGMNFENLSINCSCKIKTYINNNNSKFIKNTIKNSFLKYFKYSNFRVFKCYNVVFDLKNFFNNYGQIFITLCIIGQIIILGFYIKTGIGDISNKISTIIQTKNTTLIKTIKDLNLKLNDNSLSYRKDKKITISNPPKRKNKDKIIQNKFGQINNKKSSHNNLHLDFNKLCVLKYFKNVHSNSVGINKKKIYFAKPIVYNNNFISYINYSNDNSNKNNFSNSVSNFLKYENDTNISNSNNVNSNNEKNIEKILLEKNNTKKNKKEDKTNRSVNSPFTSNVNLDNNEKSKFSKQQNNINNNNNLNNNSNNNNNNNNIKKEKKIKIKSSFEKHRSYINNKNLNKTEIKKVQIFDEKNIKNSNLPEIPISYSKEEIDMMGYKMALKYDKMGFLSYYWLLLKYDQIILFTFYTYTDYNLKIIKYSLFIFGFNLYLIFNAFFFDEGSFKSIYKHKGKYDFFYSLPKSIFSSICCALINYLLHRLSLSQKLVEKIKMKNSYQAEKKIEIMKKRLKIKLIFFYIILFFFMLLFWYYISTFCGIYRNTQLKLFKATLITFIITMFFPFIFCMLIAFTRKIALKKKSRFLFKISKFLHHF